LRAARLRVTTVQIPENDAFPVRPTTDAVAFLPGNQDSDRSPTHPSADSDTFIVLGPWFDPDGAMANAPLPTPSRRTAIGRWVGVGTKVRTIVAHCCGWAAMFLARFSTFPRP
jgi:hypothetical protein